MVPQRLKPAFGDFCAARLKSCPAGEVRHYIVRDSIDA